MASEDLDSVEFGVIGVIKQKFLFKTRPKPMKEQRDAVANPQVVEEPASKRARLIEAM